MSSLIVKVVKIEKIIKHPNADRLRIASFYDMGWNCIIGLNDLEENDLAVFIPPDSILPEELAEKYKLEYLKKGARVKTIKLRGYISQGVCLPIQPGFKEGQNVAKQLGIVKYEPPEPSYQKGPKESIVSLYRKYREGKIAFKRLIKKSLGLIKDSLKPKKNVNPLFTKYIDIENIKNYNTIFKEGEEVIISEKCHGTNARYANLPIPNTLYNKIKKLFTKETHQFVWGSHNVQKTPLNGNGYYGEDAYGKIAERYNLKKIIPKDYILYGEVYGKKIQELEYGLEDIDVVFFDLKYKGQYVDWDAFVAFVEGVNLPNVPVLYRGPYSQEIRNKYTNGCRSMLANLNGKDQISEGCVIKPLKESIDPRVGRKILKSISEEYLLTKNRTEHH